MALNAAVEGMDELRAKLADLAKGAVPEAVERASYAAGLIIQAEAQKNVPVEYGNLRASAYTNRVTMGAEVGFSAEYALYVHENLEQKLKGEPRPSGLGTYWNPGGPKFLEKAVQENQSLVLSMFQAYIRQGINE